MFETARLKLTAWYLIIIVIISVLFSIAFYTSSARETDKLIKKIHSMRHSHGGRNHDELHREDGSHITIEDLEETKQQVLLRLIGINTGIVVLAGFAGYFLAGRTLKPIQRMVDEQDLFISNASHELRTPIATLRAEMEGSLLEKHISDTQARNLIKSNLEELGSLQNLTNKLLQFVQSTTSSSYTSMTELSILPILREAIYKVGPLAKKKSIQIVNKANDFVLMGNNEQLQEVFITVLDNAIKYNPERSTITITSSVDKNTTAIHIIDQGPGIPEKDIPHIFERFYRADTSRSEAEGFGLGLSIAQQIIALHTGHIQVQNNNGSGVTCTITLPHSSSAEYSNMVS